MSIQSEINRLNGAKSSIAESITNKGVIVPDGTLLSSMSSLIDQINTDGLVTSVNGQIGDVVLSASDVGAYTLPTDGIPASDLANGVIPTIPSAYTDAPIVNGTAAAGSINKWARGDHIHPTDTTRAPKSHASSATTYGVGTNTNYGHLKLSDATNSSSSTNGGIAATPNAVKTAYDLANGKVTKTGDTMTGYLYLKSTELTSGTRVSSTYWGNVLQWYDSANNVIAEVHPDFRTDGRQGASLRARRKISGTTVDNHVTLFTDESGNMSVSLFSEPWRSALGLGTNGVLPITVAQGGTGATTASAARTNLGLGNAAVDNVVTIAHGGTGDTQTVVDTDVATAASNCTIQAQSVSHWGKIAMLSINIKCSVAINGTVTLGTLKSGYRPPRESAATILSLTTCYGYIEFGGAIKVAGTWAANQIFYIRALYLLA